MNTPDFYAFPKIARLSREITITEKIDGTNGVICITDDGGFFVGSRSRWITPEDDNQGFARWATEHRDELMGLGVGRHFGEWWGQGIQRKYGLDEKRFSLFNVSKWGADRPACCHVVPVLYAGQFSEKAIDAALYMLTTCGSIAQPEFMRPEGICVYHHAAGVYFKKTIDKDEEPKGARS